MSTPQVQQNASAEPKLQNRGFPWIAAGLTACLALCCAIFFRLAWRAGRELAFFQVDAAQTSALRAPDWVPPEWIAQARGRVAAQPPFSIFDDETPRAICSDLEKLPWVKNARELERGLPRTLKITITPRSPAAVVETRDAVILVDSDGVVLPPAIFPADRLADLPRIVKWKGNFTNPAAGARWSDEGVLDGVSVALTFPQLYYSILQNDAPDFRIVQIDVANVNGALDQREPEILLKTSGGVRIKWGRAPRGEKFGEVPVNVKFSNLAKILRDYPGLNGIAVINLRFDEPDIFDAQGQWIPRPTVVSQAGR